MTGEVAVLDEVRARELVDSIKADVTGIGDRIVAAYTGRAWEPLGYADWDSLCEAEFDGARIRIPREQRAEQVQSLRSSGLSTRAIGAALGIDKTTVAADLRTAGGNPPAAPVVGTDGKRYEPTQPPRAKQPETPPPPPTEVISAAEWRTQQPTPAPPDNPIARARAIAANSPAQIAYKAVERFRHAAAAIRQVGVDAIVADAADGPLPGWADLWLPDLDAAAEQASALASTIRRRHIRSAK